MKLEKKVYVATVINVLFIFLLLPYPKALSADLLCRLHLAIFMGQENQAKLFLDQVELEDSDQCVIEKDGQTINLSKTSILHSIAMSEHEFSKAFIANVVAKGVYIDAKDANGNTPFLLAAARAKYDLMRFLLVLGADSRSTNHLDQNALFLAAVPTNEIIDWPRRAHVTSFLLFSRVAAIHNGHSTLFNLLNFIIANPQALKEEGLSQMIDCLLAGEYLIDGPEILKILKDQKILPKDLVYSLKFNILAMSVPAAFYLGAGLLTGAFMLYWQQ